MIDSLKGALESLLKNLNLTNIITAIITLVVLLFLGKLIIKLLNKALNKTKLEASAKEAVSRIGRTIIGIITALIVVSRLGFDTSSLVALFTVLCLGLALALNDILSDVASGFVMLSTKPFGLGDYIACDDIQGTVEAVHLNHTKLRTADGILITVPNRILASSKVKDYSAYGKRRLEIKASTSYNDPVDKTLKVLMDLMKSFDVVLDDPAPLVYLTSYQASNLEYTMYCWVKSCDFLNTKREMTQRIIQVFNENNIEISYEHLNVHVLDSDIIRMRNVSGEAEKNAADAANQMDEPAGTGRAAEPVGSAPAEQKSSAEEKAENNTRAEKV